MVTPCGAAITTCRKGDPVPIRQHARAGGSDRADDAPRPRLNREDFRHQLDRRRGRGANLQLPERYFPGGQSAQSPANETLEERNLRRPGVDCLRPRQRQAVTGAILLNHTLLNTDSAIAIQGNAADSWGAPSFSQALTWSAGVIAATFGSQSYRYWRLTYTKASAGVTRDIGRLFLGAYYQPTDPPDWAGTVGGRTASTSKRGPLTDRPSEKRAANSASRRWIGLSFRTRKKCR